MGGGMGHLFRTSVFIKQFAIEDYAIISSNPLVYTFFAETKVIFVAPDDYDQSWKSFIDEKLPRLSIHELYIDSFPHGLLGEFAVWPKVDYPVYYLARRLKWENYKHHVQKMRLGFEVVYQLEELEDEHLDFVRNISRKIDLLTLAYPLQESVNPAAFNVPLDKPLWLVVHSFNQDELESLLQYAVAAAHQEKCEAYFLVISDKYIEVSNGVCIRYFPAVDWFPLATRIFTGAGFNTMQQIKPFLSKATLIPFPRQYDDQTWRARVLKTK
jgi:hypothetical protein